MRLDDFMQRVCIFFVSPAACQRNLVLPLEHGGIHRGRNVSAIVLVREISVRNSHGSILFKGLPFTPVSGVKAVFVSSR